MRLLRMLIVIAVLGLAFASGLSITRLTDMPGFWLAWSIGVIGTAGDFVIAYFLFGRNK